MHLKISPRLYQQLFILWAVIFFTAPSFAGLGPHQVLVIYDQDHPESIAIAEHYAAMRDIPLENFCPVQVQEMTGRQIPWAQFTSYWRPQLQTCIDSHNYDVLWAFALSSHLPHRVALPTLNHSVSLVAALQTFFLTQDDTIFAPIAHSAANGVLSPFWQNPTFVGTENPAADFEIRSPGDTTYNATSSMVRSLILPQKQLMTVTTSDFEGALSFAYHLEGFTHTDGMALVDNAIAGENESVHTGIFAGMRGLSEPRQIRDPETEFLTSVLAQKGKEALFLQAHDGSLLPEKLTGFFTGAQYIHDTFPFLDFHPAAMADNVTSYGAVDANWICSDTGCPENEVQTAIGHLIALGASQVHGTVDEPLNNSFPNAGAYYLYDAGYTAAESWFYNQPFLFWQNAYWGDGLAAPFCERPRIEITTIDDTVVFEATHSKGVSWLGIFRAGQKVSEVNKETLSIKNEELGEGYFLIVAQAQSHEDSHAGLDVSAQLNHSSPMGWIYVDISEFVLDTSSPIEPKQIGGCQCHAKAKNTKEPWLLGSLFLMFFALRRQRKRD